MNIPIILPFSIRNTIYRVSTEFPIRYFIPPAFRETIKMQKELVWGGTFQNRLEHKDYAIHLYNQHNERVQKLVPKEKLLVLDITKNGGRWKELCEFLEIEEPPENISFPFTNDSNESNEKIQKLNRFAWTVIFIGISIFLVVIAYLLSYLL